MSRKKVLVDVRQFERGTQGRHHPVEQISRAIHHVSHIGPDRKLGACCSWPLKRRSYSWVSYLGRRWPVLRSDQLTYLETGAQYILQLAAKDIISGY